MSDLQTSMGDDMILQMIVCLRVRDGKEAAEQLKAMYELGELALQRPSDLNIKPALSISILNRNRMSLCLLRTLLPRVMTATEACKCGLILLRLPTKLVQLLGTRLQSGVHPHWHPHPRFAGDRGVHPQPHPRFAGDRGSTPIPIPDLPGIGDHPHPRFPSGVQCPGPGSESLRGRCRIAPSFKAPYRPSSVTSLLAIRLPSRSERGCSRRREMVAAAPVTRSVLLTDGEHASVDQGAPSPTNRARDSSCHAALRPEHSGHVHGAQRTRSVLVRATTIVARSCEI